MIREKSGRGCVVLGYCEDCGREVTHDEEQAEFFYDKERPLRLEAVFCPSCALARFGVLPAGAESAEDAEACLDRLTAGLPVRRGAREEILKKLREGRRVTGGDLAELAGITQWDMRGMSAITNAAERLRRYWRGGYRRVGTPRVPPATGDRRGHLIIARDAETQADSQADRNAPRVRRDGGIEG